MTTDRLVQPKRLVTLRAVQDFAMPTSPSEPAHIFIVHLFRLSDEDNEPDLLTGDIRFRKL
jgi:hypothetical protein